MPIYKDAIRVTATEEGEPVAFRWRGRMYRVESIEEIREPRLDWWSPLGEVHRIEYMLVAVGGMICEIYQDQVTGEWVMAKVYD